MNNKQDKIDSLYKRIAENAANADELIQNIYTLEFFINRLEDFQGLELPKSRFQTIKFAGKVAFALRSNIVQIWNMYSLYSNGKLAELFSNPYTWELLQIYHQNFSRFIADNTDFVAEAINKASGLPKTLVEQDLIPLLEPLLAVGDSEQAIFKVNKLIMRFMDAQSTVTMAQLLEDFFEIANHNDDVAEHVQDPQTHKQIFKFVLGLHKAATNNTDKNNTLLNGLQKTISRLNGLGLTYNQLVALQPIFDAALQQAFGNQELQKQLIELVDRITNPKAKSTLAELSENLFSIMRLSELTNFLYSEKEQNFYADLLVNYLAAPEGGMKTLATQGLDEEDVKSLKPIISLGFRYLYNHAGVKDNKLQILLREFFKEPLEYTKLSDCLFAFMNDFSIKSMLKEEERAIICNIIAKITLNNEMIKEKLTKHDVNPAQWEELVNKSVNFVLEQIQSNEKRSLLEEIISNIVTITQQTSIAYVAEVDNEMPLAANDIPLSDVVHTENDPTLKAIDTMLDKEGSLSTTAAIVDIVMEKFAETKELVNIVIDNVNQSKDKNQTNNNAAPAAKTKEQDLVSQLLTSIKTLTGGIAADKKLEIIKNAIKVMNDITQLAKGAAPVVAGAVSYHQDLIKKNIREYINENISSTIIRNILNNHTDTVIKVISKPANLESFSQTVELCSKHKYLKAIPYIFKLITSKEVGNIIKTFLKPGFKSASEYEPPTEEDIIKPSLPQEEQAQKIRPSKGV